MPVTINTAPPKPKFDLKVADLMDGEAYESRSGDIYIGNRFGSVVAFSVDGYSVIFSDDSSTTFRAIRMEINVSLD